jgi:hypothetical protein
MGLGFELGAYTLAKQALYRWSHISSPQTKDKTWKACKYWRQTPRKGTQKAAPSHAPLEGRRRSRASPRLCTCAEQWRVCSPGREKAPSCADCFPKGCSDASFSGSGKERESLPGRVTSLPLEFGVWWVGSHAGSTWESRSVTSVQGPSTRATAWCSSATIARWAAEASASPALSAPGLSECVAGARPQPRARDLFLAGVARGAGHPATLGLDRDSGAILASTTGNVGGLLGLVGHSYAWARSSIKLKCMPYYPLC